MRYTDLMKNTKKSFSQVNSSPVGIEYRLRRALDSASAAEVFVRSIDPTVFPTQHAAILEAVATLASAVRDAMAVAPTKKARASAEERQAKAAAEARRKAEARAAKAAAKATKPAKEPKAKPERTAPPTKVASATPAPIGGSAIERALAAARARKAAKEVAA